MQSEFIARHHSKAAIVALYPSSRRPDAYRLWQQLVIPPLWTQDIASSLGSSSLLLVCVYLNPSDSLQSEMICYLNWDLPAFS